MGWMVRGSNPGGGARFSTPVQTGPGAHPASCTMGTGSFPGLEGGWGVEADPSPPSSAMVKNEYYFPYGPYGLYRASVLVQGCALPYLYTQKFACWDKTESRLKRVPYLTLKSEDLH